MPTVRPANRRLLGAILRFIVLLPVLHLSLGLLRADRVFTPMTAYLAGGLMRLLMPDVVVQGSVIRGGGFGVDIYYGCDAEDVVMLFAAAVLAFPCGWRAKLLGVVGGTVLIVLFNLLRITSLFYVGRWAPSMFDVAHLVIWQVTGIVFATALFVVWLERVADAR